MKNFFLKDSNILILIFLNAIVIFISGFSLPPETVTLLEYFDAFFTVAFILEMIIKLKEYGSKGYFGSTWNTFDFILVVISIPSLAVMFLHLKTADFSFLLAFRVFRVFKVFRVFTFIPGINNLINSIKRGVKASILILVSFLIFLFAVSILSNNLFHEAEVYNNPATALYTTVQLISIEGWYEIPQAVQEDIPEINIFFMRLFFVVILIVGGIFGLSFVNAVLVDSMTLDNTDNLEDKVDQLSDELREIKKLLQNKNKET